MASSSVDKIETLSLHLVLFPFLLFCVGSAPSVASTESLSFCFFFGGASFFDATTADATSAAGNTAADSLVIHQGKECDDKEEDE